MRSEYRECVRCKAKVPGNILDQNLSVCPECGNYMRFHAKKRIKSIADSGTFKEWENREPISNPLNDAFYQKAFEGAKIRHNLNDAIVDGEMEMDGIRVAIGIMDTRFMMASMGHIVGERITRLFETATRRKLPVIVFCCSGGARMQEGMISLMQMEKTAAAVKRHGDAGGLYISVLTNPTMGGVTASFATLADIILAEKGAMIGFAGARVIEQNTGVKLPEGFQTAEFQREHGFVDAIVTRENTKACLSYLLRMHAGNKKRPGKIRETKAQYRRGEAGRKSAWEKVMIARSLGRPTSMDYIGKLFDGFFELCGDRLGGDDHAVVAGLAEFHACPVTVIGHQKGKGSMEDAIYRNWGMPLPQGYRKVFRLMKQAEKFCRPVICFVDTTGAACGKEAEENGQGPAIASLLQEMCFLKTPVLSIVIGEGGSGGALALGIGNEVWMLENAVYSILTPESYASILWRDNSKAPEAAQQMKLEADDLYALGIIDRVIREDEPVTVENMDCVCARLNADIADFLYRYQRKRPGDIAKERYRRFRKF